MKEGTIAGTDVAERHSGWTGGRVAAAVIGSLLVLLSLGSLGGGATALWVDRTQRDAAGYVTTRAHGFSATGSALMTDPVDLGSPGVGWLYSPLLLDKVRVRVTPASAGSPVFVGIGPTEEVDRFLEGVSHSVISDFWSGSVEMVGGGAPGSDPATQTFWVASASGPGTRDVVWEPTSGSWTVVVMRADARPRVDVTADLGATMPVLPWVGWIGLAVGAAFLIGGVLLIRGAVRRAGRARTA
ncbi:MAG: hypothetical protein ACM3OO_05995 [Planctomycetaceae bacterium]